MTETGTAGKLLVIDDNRVNRLLLVRGLEQKGHTVAFAENGRQGMEMLRSTPFDLVLLDIEMPELDGFQVLQQLKACPETEQIPVIAVTAWNSTADKLRGFELGVVDYLPKPFDRAELRARIRSVLRHKHLQDELTRANHQLLAARIAAEAAGAVPEPRSRSRRHRC